MKKANGILSTLDVQQFSEDIYISYGSPVLDGSARGQVRKKDPRLVIIFGWMDAPAKPIFAKYAVRHRKMYPNSDIAVVCSRTGFMWWAEKRREGIVRPLAKYVMETVYTQNPSPLEGILLHVLSNGGALNLLIFSEVLHRLFTSSPEAVPRIRMSIVLDSAPGNGEWTSAYTTFLTGLGMNKPGKSIGKGAVAAATTAIWVGYTLKNKAEGLDGLFTRLHNCLLKEDVMPCSAPSAPPLHPRLYIYSTADTMVPSSSIDAHLERFLRDRSLAYRERGVWVRRMDGVPHLAGERVLGSGKEEIRDGVAVQEPAYWELVHALWDASASLNARAKL